ncbi:hypothetical protein ABA45_11955 [Marinobacter psychrophilus]|jgi:hypothetical protein|uniref:Uncharacterized protein n=1 Tax=Marinobacter psychrophilus TaxID=330734 RepID=A0A0H4IDE4_9GAMM|nr:hypothetical protein [Marinobacter psychrophilus]AKO53027.1 hypothetical protein ABA45_11955 [Marinobacter psychrophilus]
MMTGPQAVTAESQQVHEAFEKLQELVLASSFDNDETAVVWQGIDMERSTRDRFEIYPLMPRSIGN